MARRAAQFELVDHGLAGRGKVGDVVILQQLIASAVDAYAVMFLRHALCPAVGCRCFFCSLDYGTWSARRFTPALISCLVPEVIDLPAQLNPARNKITADHARVANRETNEVANLTRLATKFIMRSVFDRVMTRTSDNV